MPKKSKKKNEKMKKTFFCLTSKYDKIMQTDYFLPIFQYTNIHTILNRPVDGIVRKINIC